MLPIAVNVSRADIYRYHLTDTFCHLIQKYGIETWEQAKCLEKLGCDYGQGYYFAKPMSATEFEELIKNQSVHNMTLLKHKKRVNSSFE